MSRKVDLSKYNKADYHPGRNAFVRAIWYVTNMLFFKLSWCTSYGLNRSLLCISQGAMLLCGNHDYTKESFDLITGKIELKDGAWVGAKAVVCPGVTMGEGSVLTAGSVATRDIERDAVCQGNPAVVKKQM